VFTIWIQNIPEDVALLKAVSARKPSAAEDILHDIGRVSSSHSDTGQAMGRVGEVIIRTLADR